jgi:hypothetical protein
VQLAQSDSGVFFCLTQISTSPPAAVTAKTTASARERRAAMAAEAFVLELLERQQNPINQAYIQ